MKTFSALIICLGLVAWLSSGDGAAKAAEPLNAGDPAPNFELKGSDGKTHKLSEFKGKKAVVVAWFPKAFTGG